MAQTTTNQWSTYRHGKRWTKRDDTILVTMFQEQADPIEIAKKLYRRESAIFDRLKLHKLVYWDKEAGIYKKVN